MTDTTQDVLGRAIIKEAVIYNIDGVSLSITDNLISVQIHEDIYNPFVSCEMMLVDYDSLAKKFPLVGEEFFRFSYQSIKGKIVTYEFFLGTKDTAGMNEMNTAKGYVLRGVTKERAFDSAKTVTRGYVGTYASIAGQIFDDYIKPDSDGYSFEFEPSRGVSRYTVPQISPLAAIEYCRGRSVATGEARTPFTFFRNSDGYSFTSLSGLFNRMATQPSAAITHTYAARQLPAEYDEQLANGTKVDIVKFDVASFYDTTEKIDGGAYNADTYSFDLTTKAFVLKKRFNLAEQGNKFQLGGEGYVNRTAFADSFANTRCVAYYVPTDCAWELNDGNSTQKDFYPEYLGEMRSYSNLLSEYNVHYTIYGDSDVTSGQVMKINIPQSRELASKGDARGQQDKMYSGSFLCARVVHIFNFGENVDYFVHISAINGARNYSIEDIRK
jgi:hypothetical protein